MKPRCYNRPPFNDFVCVPVGWTAYGELQTDYIRDPMSKGCQQHGPMGEATLHPELWACDGCRWKPEINNVVE